MNAKEFVVDYIKRHAHPANAVLHIVGVPSAFFGVYCLFTGQVKTGLGLIVFGYFLQYLGHRAQGNEVGEVTLIKSIVRNLKKQAGGNV
jgi:uncharacterized membrane protein YGL010W